jgi:hypothetical protein
MVDGAQDVSCRREKNGCSKRLMAQGRGMVDGSQNGRCAQGEEWLTTLKTVEAQREEWLTVLKRCDGTRESAKRDLRRYRNDEMQQWGCSATPTLRPSWRSPCDFLRSHSTFQRSALRSTQHPAIDSVGETRHGAIRIVSSPVRVPVIPVVELLFPPIVGA